jgi:hypothetical protein
MAAATTIAPPVAYAEETRAGIGVGAEVGVGGQQEVLLPQPSAKKIPVSVTIAFGASSPARPESILFGALADPTLRLRKAIPLEVSNDESAVVISWAEIDEFGCGQTLGAALDDFGAALIELHHRLHDQTVQLGPDLENVKRVLATYIEARK